MSDNESGQISFPDHHFEHPYMQSHDKAQETARTLQQLRDCGERTTGLPQHLKPATRAEGYAAQACLEGFSAEPLFGWKIAATSLAGQQHINVDGPLAGRLLGERRIVPDAEVPLRGNQMLVVEAEFAFCMGRDLVPRAAPYVRDEVTAAIASLHPALEVPNSRFAPFEAAGAPQLIADNACAEYFLVGEAAPESWRSIDLARHSVTAHDGVGAIHTGSGANVLGDPLLALTWLANELSSLTITLKAWQVVMTGTCIKPFAVRPGDHVEADFGPIGRIGARFAI